MEKSTEMDLGVFVRDTIVQIVKGIEEAKSKTKYLDPTAYVNPMVPGRNFAQPRDVEFDVAVTITRETKGKGEAKITVFGLSVGGGGQIDRGDEAVSRVKFSIPLSLPATEASLFDESAPDDNTTDAYEEPRI